MDAFWRDVAQFIGTRLPPSRMVVAPARFAEIMPVTLGYSNAKPEDAERVEIVVLHKGDYEGLDSDFVHGALGRLIPVFANEVFIVLATEGTPLRTDHPHLARLFEIKNWSATQHSREETKATRARLSAIYLGNRQVLTETIDGHLVVLPADDRAITPHIIRDGYFEIGVPRFIQRFLHPGMTFVDVGANIGLYSLAAAAVLGGRGRIVAIEPLAHLRTLLIDNLSMNGFDQQTVILPFAAGSANQELPIKAFRRYNGRSTLVDSVAQRSKEAFAEEPTVSPVQVRPLSEMLDDAGVERADLIKIDTEGYEYHVLRGALPLLSRQPGCDLVVEWHPDFWSEPDLHALLELLTAELGCTIETIEPDGSTRVVEAVELMSTEHANLWAHRGS